MHAVRGLKLGFFALFRGDGSMREIRRPKPEIRVWSTLRSSAGADRDLGRRATEDGSPSRECDKPELLDWPPSGFGLRISLGFRASNFELCP